MNPVLPGSPPGGVTEHRSPCLFLLPVTVLSHVRAGSAQLAELGCRPQSTVMYFQICGIIPSNSPFSLKP